MQNKSASQMADDVIDALVNNFGKGASGFQIFGSNEDINNLTYNVSFLVYDYFWICISYEKGRVIPYIDFGGKIVKLKNLSAWWEKLVLEEWIDDLKDEVRLRIPDKYLQRKGWN